MLVMCLLPLSAIILCSCGGNDQELKDFYTCYTKIAQNNTYLTLTSVNDDYGLNIQAYKIDLDYSLSPELSALVDNNSTKYYYIKHFYQTALDNSLSPLYFYGKALSQSDNITKKETKQLYSKLDALADEYSSISYYCGILISSLKSTANQTINLTYLNKLFTQYEQTIEQASLLSRLVSNLYFNKVLENSNLNYGVKNSYEELSDADLIAIADSTKKRVYYYKSLYSNIFNELHINGRDLGNSIINGLNVNSLVYTPYNYVAGIDSLITNDINTLRSNKEKIFSCIVSLYHIQNQIDSEYEYFEQSKSKVVYAKISSTSPIEDVNHGKVIQQFAYGIVCDSYAMLSQLVSALYTK